MSLKSAKPNIHPPLRSITARLTLFYTLATLIAVAAFTAVLYWKMTANFDLEHLHFLRAKAQEFFEDYKDGGNQPSALLSEIDKETTGTALRQYEARVLALQSAVLGETPGMSMSLPSPIFPMPVAPSAINRTATRDWYTDGHHYVLVAFNILASGPSGSTYTVQLALDVSRDDALLADYRRGLLIFLLLLLPVLLLAGRFVTKRGLRPLERITRAANVVTPANLADRIPLDPPWPPELEKLVEVFNEMMERLDEGFTRLARFSADLAHELRNPLNNLMGELEVCLTHERSAADYRATLISGLEECRRLATLIENLLFIARAENAEKSVSTERFDTREACEHVLDYHAAYAAERGVRLVCQGGAWLNADPLLFRQALGNLLANAIRYSPPDSEVRVLVRAFAGGGVEIEVRDQGEGIAPEHLPFVFDRFYQADPARVRRGQGTGLGLAIVRSIMELHGGEASLDSRPGEGSVARLRFPGGIAAMMTELSSD